MGSLLKVNLPNQCYNNRLGLLMLAAFLLSQSPSFAQTTVTWESLRQVSYATVLHPTEGYTYERIIFGNYVRSLDNQKVTLRGYMLPLDNEGYQYVISAYPYAACFFCGQAGKESVVQLWLKDYKYKFDVDEIRTFTGTFELNDDQFGLCYLLKDAVLVENAD